MILLAIFVLAAGVLMLFKPSLVWEITESWKSNDGTEPSDFYIFSTRFGGVMCTLAGIGGVIASVLL
ncbi:DUF6199 family natural product biosynthesis protein [Radiobacillus sp. PE A8.2]|uniref:DUF6199 family natural product biosynthesis protein n=1 Tax=Radiobacillus sp. PE A8.2 TaxID=3380349 RepID=UPI0038904B54